MGFAQNLRKYRNAAKLTQDQLGEMAGLGQGAISHYETGKRAPDSQEIYEALAKALNIHPAQLQYDDIIQVSSDEQDLIEKYRVADENGRNTIHSVSEIAAAKYESANAEDSQPPDGRRQKAAT